MATKHQEWGITIVSGGQTGVARAALNVALEFGIPCGGWCPKGRQAEDGIISTRYPLFQTPSENDIESTEWNVRDSDATLILTVGRPVNGVATTIDFTHKHHRQCLVVNLTVPINKNSIRQWLVNRQIKTLFISGPLASKQADAYPMASDFLRDLFTQGQ